MTILRVAQRLPTMSACSGFCDAAGPDAVGADAHPLVGFSVDDPNLLKVGIPSTLCQVMSVTDPIPINRAFITDFAALRHAGKTPQRVKPKV
jgi:hypothetical protein